MEILTVIRCGHFGPASIMRAALMDLGFAGLIEKIEERFGTFVTSALLLALVLLVFAWIIETIFSLYVSGTLLWEKNGESSILGLVKILVVHIALISITTVISYTIFRHIRNRAIRQTNQRLEEAVGEISELGDELSREIGGLGDEQVRRVHSAALTYGISPKKDGKFVDKDAGGD